jgi:hypothetical protein
MVRILFLLMLSNVFFLSIAVEMLATSESAASMEMEVHSLLKQSWAEPLPKVVKRATKLSKTMPVKEALQTVGHKMSGEIHALLQEARNTTQQSKLRTNSDSGTSATGLGDDKVFNKAMAFINNEYKTVREQLDLKLMECGFFKLQKESLLYETQDKLDELAMDMGLAEATMNACQAEIKKQMDHIEVKTQELNKLTAWCQVVHDELAAIKNAAEEDLKVINIILDVAKKECAQAANNFIQIHACLGPDDRTHFEASAGFMQEQASKFKQKSTQQAFQTMLFELYGPDKKLPGKLDLKSLDEFDDDDSDDFPEELMQANGQSFIQLESSQAPSAGTSSQASNDAQRERCSGVAAKPKCENILDKLGQMQGELFDALNDATKNLQTHDTQCELDTAAINKEIKVANNMVAEQTEQFDKASAFHNGMLIEHGQESSFKRELCKELRGKFKECYKKLKELEREMCGLIKIRQAVYNKIKNPDGAKPQLMIQDCQMSDWVVGACSGTCLDASGNSGMQIIKRTPLEGWSNTTPEGKYGASCPPDEVTRNCATTPCPIDCVMKDWSAWSECTAQCGGGSETRTRGIMIPDEHGGATCPGSTESGPCNTQSCDADCVLSDWSGWSPCTKSCRAKYSWRPGMQTRTKHIAVPTIGSGRCWHPRTSQRWQKQNCNTFPCPKTIQCVADMDVVLVQDGSGSLWYRWGGRSKWDRNFELSKDFMLKLVGKSKMSTVDANGKVGEGLRFGVVLYSFRAVVSSMITEKKSDLETKIKAMKWPMGGTMTGRALIKAKQLFPLAQGGKNRLQVIVLITDGRASNRAWAWAAAWWVRHSGIRLVVVPVKGALRNPHDMCAWASKPCADNMINTPRWTMLLSRLNLYLTTMCPTVEDPTLGTR